MLTICKYLSPVLLVLAALTLLDAGIHVDYAQARSKSGGRSFSRSRTVRPPTRTTPYSTNRYRNNNNGFMRGMAGGFLGGALGSMLFGSMFGGAGIGGTGFGLIPILIIGGIIYFLFKKMRPDQGQQSGYFEQHPYDEMARNEPVYDDTLNGGLEQIRQSEPDFDPNYFAEVAQDVFFKVQAGWTRRDVASYRHLLGDQLTREYENHFREMREKGEINKLENISVRKAEVVDAGVDGNEEFVVVHFTANLLDYTVDDKNGELIRGSMTEPVKFDEKWIWARPVGSREWKLEGIE